jgi:hypothetical protein
MEFKLKGNEKTATGTPVKKIFCQYWPLFAEVLEVLYQNGGWWSRYVIGLVLRAGNDLKSKLCP